MWGSWDGKDGVPWKSPVKKVSPKPEMRRLTTETSEMHLWVEGNEVCALFEVVQDTPEAEARCCSLLQLNTEQKGRWELKRPPTFYNWGMSPERSWPGHILAQEVPSRVLILRRTFKNDQAKSWSPTNRDRVCWDQVTKRRATKSESVSLNKTWRRHKKQRALKIRRKKNNNFKHLLVRSSEKRNL